MSDGHPTTHDIQQQIAVLADVLEALAYEVAWVRDRDGMYRLMRDLRLAGRVSATLGWLLGFACGVLSMWGLS